MGSSPSSFGRVALREAKKTSILLAKAYCFLHVTTNYLGFVAYAYGPSMIPTLHATGNFVLAERISKRSQRPIRGDVVVLRSPECPEKTPIKRVVGIEGDSITFVIDSDKNMNHKLSWFLKDMFGFKVTIFITQGTRDSLVPYLTDLSKEECFGGFGHFKILDRLDRL